MDPCLNWNHRGMGGGAQIPDGSVPQAAPVTLLWGKADFSHRETDTAGLLTGMPHAKIIVLEGFRTSRVR